MAVRLRVRPVSGVEQNTSQLCSGLFAMKLPCIGRVGGNGLEKDLSY